MGNNILIIYACGLIRLISLETLKTEGVFQASLEEGEEISAAGLSKNGINFILGTNRAALFLGSVKDQIKLGKIDYVNKGLSASIT